MSGHETDETKQQMDECEQSENVNGATRQQPQRNLERDVTSDGIQESKPVIMCYRAVTVVDSFVPSPRPCTDDVLNPSCRMAATRSAFCTGFAMYAAKRPWVSIESEPL